MEMTGEMKAEVAKVDKSSIQTAESSMKISKKKGRGRPRKIPTVVGDRKVGKIFDTVTEDVCQNLKIENEMAQPDQSQSSHADNDSGDEDQNHLHSSSDDSPRIRLEDSQMPSYKRAMCFENGDKSDTYPVDERINDITVQIERNVNSSCEHESNLGSGLENRDSCNSQTTDNAVKNGLEVSSLSTEIGAIKRKRGRPRKYEFSYEIEKEEAVIRRGPGRPPKSDSMPSEGGSVFVGKQSASQSGLIIDGGTPIKRGRGRPPKWVSDQYRLGSHANQRSSDQSFLVDAKVSGNSKAHGESEPAFENRAGPSVSEKTGEVDGQSGTTVCAVVGRGPGRPRKSETIFCNVKFEHEADGSSQADPPPNGPVVRRGRGRPPKKLSMYTYVYRQHDRPNLGISSDAPPGGINSPNLGISDIPPGGIIRRGRGRPPKHLSSQSISEVKLEPEAHSSSLFHDSKSVVKRGRGRPRKYPPWRGSTTIECDSPPIVKRGRGRPRGSKSSQKLSADGTVVQRKRGRPPKEGRRGPGRPPKSLDRAYLIKKEVDAMFRRGPGRPPKARLLQEEDNRNLIKRELETMIRRGPGRPVKKEPVCELWEKRENESGINCEIPQSSDGPDTSVSSVVRRGRGRPPKNQSMGSVDKRLITFEIEAIIRRGRGRPRKYIPIESKVDRAIKDDPDYHPGRTPKRGRGRPPKVASSPNYFIVNETTPQIRRGRGRPPKHLTTNVRSQLDLIDWTANNCVHLGDKCNIAAPLVKNEPFTVSNESDLPNTTGVISRDDLPMNRFRTTDESVLNETNGGVANQPVKSAGDENNVVKRGPGRPRKTDADRENSGVRKQEYNGPKRPRGRPRKIPLNPEAGENDGKPPKEKRPRGRPRIHPIGEPRINIPKLPKMTKTKSPSSGKRGRPRLVDLKTPSPLKVALKSVEKEVEKGRKRGRPRKVIETEDPVTKEARLVFRDDSKIDDKVKTNADSDSKSEDSPLNIENGSE